jgi:hypothetical protein
MRRYNYCRSCCNKYFGDFKKDYHLSYMTVETNYKCIQCYEYGSIATLDLIGGYHGEYKGVSKYSEFYKIKAMYA